MSMRASALKSPMQPRSRVGTAERDRTCDLVNAITEASALRQSAGVRVMRRVSWVLYFKATVTFLIVPVNWLSPFA